MSSLMNKSIFSTSPRYFILFYYLKSPSPHASWFKIMLSETKCAVHIVECAGDIIECTFDLVGACSVQYEVEVLK